MDEYIAHYRETDRSAQTVKTHLLEVKRLAESYGAELGVKHITGLAGLLHDLGKYTQEFQSYLRQAVFHPESAPRRGSVDHASAGGKLLYEMVHESLPKDQFKMIIAEIVGNAIISHHSYLHDFLNADLESPYTNRVTKIEDELPGYLNAKRVFFSEILNAEELMNYVDQAVIELKNYIKTNPGNAMEKLTLLIRFVFSCLIDADRTNTRLFEENSLPEFIDTEKLFRNYYEKLLKQLDEFNQKPGSQTDINQLRKEMSEQCERFAEKSSGIFTLSIPTGGGKTLASLRYALKHAQLVNKQQIIYVVPYTTIIEQNAKVIRNILNDDEHILEHHSNVMEIDELNKDWNEGVLSVREKLELAKDNWDCPIILTTMVQFLDTFYKLGSRNIRRLHHLTKAVIVFDEVQKVPIHCVSLFNHALNFLKQFGQSSILLCTATQPALDYVRHRLEISSEGELIKQLDRVSVAFKRVEIIDRSYRETFTNDKLAGFIGKRLREINSLLVILNTRAVVRSLYQKLKDQYSEVQIFHLSTSMCAAHRETILEKIKSSLKEKQKIVCISTQLIEAGVDVSFECVIRSLAGLDSIAQAAGRCNRNGEYDGFRKVYIIDHAEEKLDASALETIRKGKSITKKILTDLHQDSSKYEGEILSKAAMDWYFKNYFAEMGGKVDFNVAEPAGTMTKLLYSGQNEGYAKSYRENNKQHNRIPLCLVSSLRTAAKDFYVIKNMTKSVIVPYGDGKEIITQLSSAGTIEDLSKLLRRAQHYSINIYDNEQRKLDSEKQLIYYLDGQIIVLNEASYSDEYGLDIRGDGELGSYFF